MAIFKRISAITKKYLKQIFENRFMEYDDEPEEHEIYEDEGAEDLGRNDEISPEEEGFVKGYNEDIEESNKEKDEDDDL